MNILLVVAVCIVSLLLVLNSYISFLVVKSDFYEPAQKYAQYALIWLLPVVGVLLCYMFVRSVSGSSSGNYPDSYSDDVSLVSSNDGYAGPIHDE